MTIKRMISISDSWQVGDDTFAVNIAAEGGTVNFKAEGIGDEIHLIAFTKAEWNYIVEFIANELREPTMGGRE